MDTNSKKNMPFLGHIGELRKHILRALLAIAIGAVLIACNLRFVMDTVIFGPVNKDFISFRIINKIGTLLGKGSIINMPDEFPIQVRRIFGELDAAFSISLTGGFIIAFPYVIYEFWRFIAPALKQNEYKYSHGILLSTYFLFITGCLFGYFLVTPLTMQFGYFFKISDKIKTDIDLSNYISILLKSIIYMGIIFLLPVFTYSLTMIGLLGPSFLKKYRRHALIVILIIAGFITPGDIMSMLAASAPLYLLYEISIIICVRSYKRINAKKENN